MIDSGTRDFDAARAATAASIAPVHATDFKRLVKLLRHAARFQLLFIEFADAGDRDALTQRIDEVLAAAGMPVARIDLGGSGAPASFDELEQRLRRLSADHPAVHLVGADAWFDDRRWRDFNVRREAVAYGAPMKLMLWLSAQAVRRCIDVAPDLWSWRGGLFSFAPTVRAAGPDPAPGPVHATAPATPAVAPGILVDRLAQVQRLLHEQPDASPQIRLQLDAEEASLLGTQGKHEAAEACWRDTVLPLARALGDGHLVLRATQEMAGLLARHGELDAALKLLSDLETVQATSGVAALYSLPMQRAKLLCGAGHNEQALQVLQAEALPQAKGLHDAFALTLVHELIADALEDLRRYDEALRWRREQELPASALEHNPARRAQVHDRIAALLERMGRFDEAVVERQQRQIPLLRVGRDEAALGHGLARLADLMHRRGESAAALALYRDEVLPAFERTGEVAAQAYTWRRMAELLRSTGQVDAALAAVRDQALPLARRSAGGLEEVDTLTSYAKLLTDAGQPQQALQVVEQALLSLLREPQQRPHLADALGLRARVQRHLGDHGAALDTLLLQQLPLLEELADAAGMAEAWTRVAEVQLDIGDDLAAERSLRQQVLPRWRALTRQLKRRENAIAAPTACLPVCCPSQTVPMTLVKSKQRVADFGEVFTPAWMVEAMLDLVKDETQRIDSRFLEPACGSGNFLVQVLRRKLAAVALKYGRSDFERQHYALLALMCIYGIELLSDNITECRANLLEIFAEYLNLDEVEDLYRAASHVLSLNLVHGDALTMKDSDGAPISFAEWGYLGKGKFQRRDFRFDILTHSSAFSAEDSLFAHLGKHEIFTPAKTWRPMTVGDLAAGFVQVALAPSPKEEA